MIRVREMGESRSSASAWIGLELGPVMVDDRKIAWPAELSLGPDGLGNSPRASPRSWARRWILIHHFKLVTEGIRAGGTVLVEIESPRDNSACTRKSDGGTRPYRVHFRDPSFTNLQAVAACAKAARWRCDHRRRQYRPGDGRVDR